MGSLSSKHGTAQAAVNCLSILSPASTMSVPIRLSSPPRISIAKNADKMGKLSCTDSRSEAVAALPILPVCREAEFRRQKRHGRLVWVHVGNRYS